MGDFNDYPDNKSIQKILKAGIPPTETDSLDSRMLYHLLARKGIDNKHFGSYKYQGEWGLLDHIILSGSLLMPGSPLYTTEEKADVFRAPFLLTEDRKYGDEQPFRTYYGMKYQGGYSDHLPVWAEFRYCINRNTGRALNRTCRLLPANDRKYRTECARILSRPYCGRRNKPVWVLRKCWFFLTDNQIHILIDNRKAAQIAFNINTVKLRVSGYFPFRGLIIRHQRYILTDSIQVFRRTELQGSHIQIDIFIDPASATLLHPPPVLERVIDQRIGGTVDIVSSQFRIFTVFNVISSTVPLATPLGNCIQSPIRSISLAESCTPATNPRILSLNTSISTAADAPKPANKVIGDLFTSTAIITMPPIKNSNT